MTRAVTRQSLCAVIPAAGHGTRLGGTVPKVMLEIAGGVTVWHLLYRRLRPWVDHVHVIVSPEGEIPFRRLMDIDMETGEIEHGTVSVSVQEQPTGMGDAIFGAAGHWQSYDGILVVWGDQANLSSATVGEVVRVHSQVSARPVLTVPLVPMPDPYVEYDLESGELRRVRMSREGDRCRPGGLSDVGVFCLSTSSGGLRQSWERYLAEAVPGAVTGEINFLPFLPYLVGVHGWETRVVPVADPTEARGINTRDDLEFARQVFQQCAD
ncbi:NTP transferase domain-containing protein [Actinomadura sp. 6N118]|uniref:NTP transferase domain-containing protein n=1 Tax=Actinomadura sp. 6N118 TaxID=3375151 RepID=UPI00379F9CDE